MSENIVIKESQITVIGGGAAGITAAISAARTIGGNNVRIIEKNSKLGRKLLATGNGRCNYTNTDCTFYNLKTNSKRLENENFSKKALELFGVKDTLCFFEELGVLARVESEGRVYPYSEQASAVQEALTAELEMLGVDILFSAPVKQVQELKKDGFELVFENGEKLRTQKLILAAGGKAGPQYGSTGGGYQMAKSFGHTVIKPIPALVQLTVDHNLFGQLKGVRAKGKVTLMTEGGEKIASETGEIQFSEDGISGICVFNLSRNIRLADGEPLNYNHYHVILDLCPEYTEDQLLKKLTEMSDHIKGRKKEDSLNGIINRKLGAVIIKEAGIESSETSHFTSKELIETVRLLKGWNLAVSGTKGWKEAQVTSGGVDTTEIYEETMESKLVKGLYFAGEIIDIDGKCGGYNLQWAWTSGFIAGKSSCR